MSLDIQAYLRRDLANVFYSCKQKSFFWTRDISPEVDLKGELTKREVSIVTAG